MFSPALKDPRGGHNKAFINQAFFQSWKPQMAYTLGFIIADGAIEDVQKSSRTCYITITSIDKSILEDIKKVMSSQHILYVRHPEMQVFTNGKRYLSSANRYVLRIGSKLMYNDLLKLGVTPRKSLTIPFPSIPESLLHFFIRGYFDGDGCVYLIRNLYPKLIFTSGSIKFLEGLSSSLSKKLTVPLGKIYVTKRANQKPCYRLVYNVTLSRIVLNFIYKDLDKSPYLERKYLHYTSVNKTKF